MAGERPHLLARDLAPERARERLLAGEHTHVVEHRFGVGERLLAADERQERRGQHRTAAPQPVRPVLDSFHLRQDLRQLDGRRLVDDHPHRALVGIVGDQQDDTLRKVRVFLVRGRDQQLALGRTSARRRRDQTAPLRRRRSGLRTC
jgi:hypothetical protein